MDKVPDAEDDPDAPGVPGIDIGQIGLFRKDDDPASAPAPPPGRPGPARQADHLLIFGITQHLDPAVPLSSSRQKSFPRAVKKYSPSAS